MYRSQRLDHLGIVAGICDQIEIVETIDAFFPEQERKVTVGEATKAMILNALGFSSRPLYLTPEFFSNKPVGLLFREELQASDFNDDSLGRALEALFEQDITNIFQQVASHALRIFTIVHSSFHLDTSSMSFHGEYKLSDEGQVDEGVKENEGGSEREDDEERKPVHITKGYSKDHRPDLKQVVVSLICCYKSSLPVWLEVLDGNSSDKNSFPVTIESYVEQLTASGESVDGLCFIVDSALFTKKNIQQLANVHWLSRVPETITKAQKLLEGLDEEEFAATSLEGYKLHEVGSDYGGIQQRWIVVRSEKGYERDNKSLEKRIEKARESAQKALAKLKAQEFNCEQDAKEAAEQVQKRWRFHRLVYELKEVPHFATRGRPKKDATPVSTGWKIEGELEVNEEVVGLARKKLGRFILATNRGEEFTAEQALIDYKAQGSSVERGFRFLKDPMFFASGLYLKKPERVMALIMVMGLSLLVYSLAERHLRQQLRENEDTLPDQKGKPTQRITMRRVFQVFEGIDLLLLDQEAQPRRIVMNLSETHEKIIGFLGPAVKKYYDSDP